MKIADLYIRTSIDQHADKSYSKIEQEKILRRFCITQSLRIGSVIYEEHSAKTFRRPEWTRLMSDLRKRKRHVDIILFARWDRFTTNAENASRMSNILRKLGTEVQAVEQPLDLSVHADRILLAFYLDAPETENRHNSLNAFSCRQQSKKNLGHQSNTAAGFKTKTNKDKIKNLDEEKPVRTSSRGLMKDVCPTYTREEIWEAFFYLVGDKFSELKKQRRRVSHKENLPFQELLICPRCGLIPLANSSKQFNYPYNPDRCTRCCGCQSGGDKKNKPFVSDLRKSAPGSEKLYKAVVQVLYKNRSLCTSKTFTDILISCNKVNNMSSFLALAEFAFFSERELACKHR